MLVTMEDLDQFVGGLTCPFSRLRIRPGKMPGTVSRCARIMPSHDEQRGEGVVGQHRILGYKDRLRGMTLADDLSHGGVALRQSCRHYCDRADDFPWVFQPSPVVQIVGRAVQDLYQGHGAVADVLPGQPVQKSLRIVVVEDTGSPCTHAARLSRRVDAGEAPANVTVG